MSEEVFKLDLNNDSNVKIQRQVKKESENKKKTSRTIILRRINVAVVVLAVIVVAGLGFWQVNNNNQYDVAHKLNYEEYLNLKSKLDDLNNNAKTYTPYEVSNALNDCKTLGNKVADLQNNYKGLSSTTNETVFNENVSALSKCFSDDSQNGKSIWYASDQTSYVWTFQTIYGFTNDDLGVMWLCKPADSDEILCCVMANYDVTNKVFKAYEKMTTKYGTKMADSASYSGTTTNSGNVDNIVKQLQNLGWTDNKINSDMNDIEDAREEYKKSQGY